MVERTDRVHWFAGRVHEVLDDLGDPFPVALTAEQTAESLVELERAAARLAGLALRLVARAERTDLPSGVGATCTGAWLRGLLPVTRRVSVSRARLARSLAEGHERVDEALVAGRVLPDQAEVICAAVDSLPTTVGVDTRRAAETRLLAEAERFDAVALARLGERVLHVVAPEVADAVDAAKLEAQERAAARRTSLSWGRDGRGCVQGRFTLPERYGQMLAAALDGFTNPAGADPVPLTEPDTEPDPEPGTDPAAADRPVRRLSPVVRGEAFCRLLETLDPATLPTTGGLAATVLVTIPLETLLGGLAAAGIVGTDTRVSPGEARRMACAAGLIPVVLGGDGQPLDVGRRRRYATKAQILALRLAQQGVCAVEHCDRPAHRCDAHHWRRRWKDGGRTDLTDLVLICPRHHTLAHQPGMTLHPGTGGKFMLHRRT